MERFLQLYQNDVAFVLDGYDRMLFRGVVRSINFAGGLEKFLVHYRIKLKHFAPYAQSLSKTIKQHAKNVAKRFGRPYVYLNSASANKEQVALKILADHPVKEGLVAVLACVEPCHSFDVRSNGNTKRLELCMRPRQCLHLYFYYLDRDFGLMHVRLQTWLPFPIQVCLNGREYLARQLDKEGIGYEKRANAFSRIDNVARAQELIDRLQTRRWDGFLNLLARRVMPLLSKRSQPWLRPYYWMLRQGEVATDVVFKNDQALAAIYPDLIHHAMRYFSSKQVMRFLGRRTDRRFQGEVVTDLTHRPEGVRIKHRVEENSIKMYDKQGCILRIETTINAPTRFYVRRTVTRNGQRLRVITRLRKGVVDIPRRTQLSKAANQRYLEALAGMTRKAPIHRVLDPVCRPKIHRGRAYRALRPLSVDEAKIYRLLLDGRFALQGIRNRDLRELLTSVAPTDRQERRRLSAKATRWFRLLRAHGIIQKTNHARHYRLTTKGIETLTVSLQLRNLESQRLAA